MRRRDPILWLTGLVLAVTWSVGLWESLQWVDRPFPGFLVLENRVVASAGLARWPAIEGGEIYQREIVAVNGVALDEVADLHELVASVPTSTPLLYSLRRGDEITERVIATRRFEPLDFLLLFGSMLLCGVAVGATALGIRFLRKDRLATGSFALLAIAGIWGVSAVDLYGPYHLFRLHALCETLLFAGALHMALVFPHPSRLIERWPRLTLGVYGAAAALALANQAGLQRPDLYVVTHQIAVWAFGLALVVLAGSHVRWYLWPPSFEARQRVKVVAFGAVAALLPSALLALAGSFTGRDAAQNAIAFSAILYPLSIGYAVLRHDLLEVDAFLRRSVTYAIVTAGATFAYLGVGSLVDDFLHATPAAAEIASAGTFFAVFALMLLLRDRVQGGIDRVFFHSAYDFRRVVETVSSQLAGTADLAWIRRKICDAVGDALHPERVGLYLANERGMAVWGDAEAAETGPSAERVMWLARWEAEPCDLEDGELLVPFHVDGQLVAALVLGRPLSGRLYGGEDRRLLHTLANQGAVAIRNAIALEELRDLNRDLEVKVEERTEALREAQAQLVHREKMASLGQFVAGIAHELNNPLNFIQGNLYHLRDYVGSMRKAIRSYEALVASSELGAGAVAKVRATGDLEFVLEDLGAAFAGCEEGLDRSTTLVKDLRTFSRLDQPDRMPEDLHVSIESTINLLRSKLIKVRVEREFGDLPTVECIAGQLNQVFLNLIANAADALGEEGTITIRTMRLGDDRVRIEVEDDGPGIDEVVKSRIFDPFFTTKEVGQGTGLGLSISYAIVQRHGGTIEVISEPGEGCCFRVELPIHVEPE